MCKKNQQKRLSITIIFFYLQLIRAYSRIRFRTFKNSKLDPDPE